VYEENRHLINWQLRVHDFVIVDKLEKN